MTLQHCQWRQTPYRLQILTLLLVMHDSLWRPQHLTNIWAHWGQLYETPGLKPQFRGRILKIPPKVFQSTWRLALTTSFYLIIQTILSNDDLQNNSMTSVNERTIPATTTCRRTTFVDRWCHVVSMTDP
jgi:hypothetical protein